MQIWDSGGQEKFKSIVRNYYRGSHACIFLYDITDYSTYKNVKKWMEDVENHSSGNMVKILVGTKTDLEHKRKVKYETALFFAASNKMKHFEISSKNNSNIDDTYTQLAELLYHEFKEGRLEVQQYNYTNLLDNNKNKYCKCVIN